ncbi:hypothetical protein [Shewanella gelidii]|uniref:Extradiol ring-cleavage dioxygenase LigAB LigA subunit domain-containing protein n=1 Tax=Shewanella gelidii TaxID=1642821 RepID=A0A917JJZ1_9GAMM|nr:hypothetical protein [Shewanella gelidii]MCL1096535.1 hypothetical protein [Shewanella gelidii]GGI68150.1 hypothetical protein GCM10009332_01670 [Shewanella gelidii]
MSKLKDFMVDLASDAKLTEAYRQNPIDTMKSYGLTDDEIKAVMSNDQDALKKITGEDDFQHYIIIHKFDE